MAAVVEARREPYVGEKKKQLRDGYGVYVYENKFFKYEGEWTNGKKHGHGKLTMADGSFYEGEFTNGEIEGHGYRFFAANRNTYSGQFHMGELHGQGVMKYGDGSAYEGEWIRNCRQGYGVFRCPDNSVYQGYLHNHRRHGEGTQIYSNGDRYDGDWILDKRQGHGELRERDGTVYDGQWMNNTFSGEGKITHSSGMFYEGLWVNGQPAVMSARLRFKGIEDLIEVTQGMPFSVEVECVDEDGQLVEDMGREIQLVAGYKYSPPPKDESAVPKDGSSTGLFDMIEDMEENPIQTPFGYSIIPYPLTDQFPYMENDEALMGIGSRTNTTVSEAINEDESKSKEAEKAKEEETKDVDTTEPTAEANEGTTEGTTTDEGQTTSDPQDQPQGEDQGAGAAPGIDEVPLPPPVSNRKCRHGTVAFDSLVLSAPPPMYRPFTQMDDNEKKPPKSRQSKKSEEDNSRPTTRSKSREKSSVGDDRFARAASRGKSAKSEKSVGKSGRKSVSSGRSKKKQPEIIQVQVEEDLPEEEDEDEDSDDEEFSAKLSLRFSPPGEYVIMAIDATNPPFVGKTIEPAFMVVKVNVPKKPKKVKKDPRPKWDTSKHIAANMARGYSDLAMEEAQNLVAAGQV